jgi:hypothetical protein
VERIGTWGTGGQGEIDLHLVCMPAGSCEDDAPDPGAGTVEEHGTSQRSMRLGRCAEHRACNRCGTTDGDERGSEPPAS